MLRLRHGHSVPGHDDHFVRCCKNCCSLLRRGAAHRARLLLGCGRSLLLSERPEEHVRKRAIHRFGHVHGKDETRCAVQRASNDQQFAVQNEAHRRGGESRIRIQREITVGISAPPMGIIIITPNRSGMPTINGKSCVFSGCATNMLATTIATPRSPRLTMFCPLYVIGRCGRTSCNFPAAIKLPVNVSEPRMTSSESTPIMKRGTSGVRK